MAEQKIRNFDLLEDLDLDPETIREFYTTEFFQRALAHLFALYENKWRALRSTANGELLIYQSQTYIEKYDVIEATAGDTESTPYLFSFPPGVNTTKVVEVHTTTNPVLIRFIPYDDTVLEQIYHDSGMVYIRMIAVKGFKIKNANTGANAFIRVIGWY